MKRILLATCAFAVLLIGEAVGAEETVKEELVVATEKDRALAKQMEDLARKARGTPGQEMANLMLQKDDWRHFFYLVLKGKKKVRSKLLERARKIFLPFMETTRKGIKWPRPPKCKVPYADKAPCIDGKLDEAVWQKAATYTGVYVFEKTSKRQDPATTWKILWDEKYLYFAFDCADTDVISPKRKRDGAVFKDDCVEMFILPEFRNGTYWELVVGPDGSIYDGLNNKHRDKFGALSYPDETIKGLKTGHSVRGTLNKSNDTDEGYIVEVAVPCRSLPEYSRTDLAAGHKLHFMLVRLDRNGKEHTCYAYQPLLNWGHNIWNHGDMVLQKKK